MAEGTNSGAELDVTRIKVVDRPKCLRALTVWTRWMYSVTITLPNGQKSRTVLQRNVIVCTPLAVGLAALEAYRKGERVFSWSSSLPDRNLPLVKTEPGSLGEGAFSEICSTYAAMVRPQ